MLLPEMSWLLHALQANSAALLAQLACPPRASDSLSNLAANLAQCHDLLLEVKALMMVANDMHF